MGWIDWIVEKKKEFSNMTIGDMCVLLVPIWGAKRIDKYKSQMELLEKERDEFKRAFEALNIRIGPSQFEVLGITFTNASPPPSVKLIVKEKFSENMLGFDRIKSDDAATNGGLVSRQDRHE